MVRRFSRRMLQSRVLLKAKSRRFRQEKKTKLAQKVSALKRKEARERFMFLRKIGKLPEEMTQGRAFGQKKFGLNR